MKKAIFLLVVSFLLSASLYSQITQYEITVKYNGTGPETKADITVTVKAGVPEFTYYLMTNDPVKGDVLMKSEATRRKSYVFREVKPGKYFLKIEDGKGMAAGKTVNVTENQL
jgi:hypothetical protein